MISFHFVLANNRARRPRYRQPEFKFWIQPRELEPLPDEVEVGEGVERLGEQREQGYHLTPVPSQVMQLYTLVDH